MTQTAQPSPVVSRAARIAFWALVAVTGFWTAIHVAGIFFIADGDDERLMFTCYAALNVLALVVLLVPFRGGQPWAWAASWIPLVPNVLVMPILGREGPGPQYLAITAVMAVCLLVARPTARL
jgi:hypothetical protein